MKALKILMTSAITAKELTETVTKTVTREFKDIIIHSLDIRFAHEMTENQCKDLIAAGEKMGSHAFNARMQGERRIGNLAAETSYTQFTKYAGITSGRGR